MIIYERLPPRLSPDWRLCNKTVTRQLESPSSKLMPRGRCQLPYPFPVRPIWTPSPDIHIGPTPGGNQGKEVNIHPLAADRRGVKEQLLIVLFLPV